LRKADPGPVLRELARTLDVSATLACFPGLSAADLSRILAQAAGPVTGELFSSPPPAAKEKSADSRPSGPPAGRPAKKPAAHPAAAHGPATLHIDGGARGNPGPAGTGALLRIPGEEPVGRGEYIGEATNNTAEYRALLLGLALAREHKVDRLRVLSDSELLVRQMTGAYRVKHPDLKILHAKAQAAASHIESVSYAHIPREKNADADELVNRAIDARGKVSL
jgi:ribonuclease HI